MSTDGRPTHPSSGDAQGRFELRPPEFADKIFNKPKDCLHVLDLKDVMPDVFAGTTHIPSLLLKVCRQALDDLLFHDAGFYCHEEGSRIRIFFDVLPAAAAQVKIQAVAQKIPELLKNPEAANPQGAGGGRDKGQAAHHADQDLHRVIHEGLSENPTKEEVNYWGTRVTQNIIHGHHKTPLVRELVDLAMKSEPYFLPLWNAHNETLVGGICGAASVSRHNTGEAARHDIAVLSAACLEMLRLSMKKEQALVVVPVRISTLQDKNLFDLYLAVLHKLTPEMKKDLIFEIKDAPRDHITPGIKILFESLAPFCRALIVDTGLLAHAHYDPAAAKIYACGFDIAGLKMKGDELIRLLTKYAEDFKKHGFKTYIKGVATQEVLMAAKRSGFSYLSGSAIRAPQKTCPSVQRLSFLELGKRH